MNRLLRGLRSSTCIVCIAACAVSAQEADMDMAALQGTFSTAMEVFDSPNQAASIEAFKKVIDALAGHRGLPPEAGLLLKKSYEYRARALFNKGDDATCNADLRSLIAIDPGYQIDKTAVSPKFYNLFENIRISSIGFLRIASVPPGAAVYLDGEPIGQTDLADRAAITGTHSLRLSRKGFEEVTEEITVESRQTLTRSYTLTRTAASLSVATIPAGVHVKIDGQPAGTTQAGEAESSVPLVIDGLTVGKHIIEFSRPCYETSVRSLAIDSIQDLEVPPITLDSSTATLTITSAVPGGRATIDGTTNLGQLPVENATVCSGDHVVEVVYPAGKYAETLSLKKGDAVSLKAQPRPTLVFLGVASEPDLAASALEREKQIANALRSVQTLNTIVIPYQDGLKLLRRVGLTPNAFITPDKNRTEQERKLLKEALPRLCAEAKADLVALGVLARERIQENLFLNFTAPPLSSVESFYIDPVSDDIKKIVGLLSQPFAMYRSWLGCRTVDVKGAAGPVVLALSAEGPASAAKLTVGQVIVEAGGTPVASSADLAKVVASAKPGDRMSLKVAGPKRDSPPVVLEVQLGSSPIEVPLSNVSLLVSRQVAELSIAIKGGTDGLAHMLMAQCFMRLGDFQGAFEQIQRAQTGTTWGVSDGTVAYYRGRILLQLGYKREAAESFRTALSFPRATLYDNDGKLVTEMAQRYLRDLAP